MFRGLAHRVSTPGIDLTELEGRNNCYRKRSFRYIINYNDSYIVQTIRRIFKQPKDSKTQTKWSDFPRTEPERTQLQIPSCKFHFPSCLSH